MTSFTATTGNVWSNPELTCQHVDPAPPLPAHGTATVEVKLLVTRGTLADASTSRATRFVAGLCIGSAILFIPSGVRRTLSRRP